MTAAYLAPRGILRPQWRWWVWRCVGRRRSLSTAHPSDDDAFMHFVERYQRFIDAMARRHARWDTPKDDVRQELYIVLWQLSKRYSLAHPDIDRITRTVLARAARAYVAEVHKAAIPPLVDADDSDALDRGENGVEVMHLPALSPRERQVLAMKGLRGMTSDQIGRRLGIAPSTVRRHWGRTFRKFTGNS